jgi:hypothetical protein
MKVAEDAWKKLLRWISLCRIPEMIKVGKMVRNYFLGGTECDTAADNEWGA